MHEPGTSVQSACRCCPIQTRCSAGYPGHLVPIGKSRKLATEYYPDAHQKLTVIAWGRVLGLSKNRFVLWSLHPALLRPQSEREELFL